MTIRYHYLILFLFSLAMMGAALYFQHIQGLEPCPLCIFQRFAVIGIGLVALTGFIHNPRMIGQRIYGVLLFLSALWGVIVAGRHVWLQHLPKDQVPACGPGLDYWLETLPLSSVINNVFKGSGECAEVDWRFMGFSMPELTLPLFILLAAYAIWLFFKAKNPSTN